MSALEGVASVLFMIKLPDIPGVRRVAATAFFAHSASVIIVLFMATNAIGAGAGELITHMTTLARHHLVHTH